MSIDERITVEDIVTRKIEKNPIFFEWADIEMRKSINFWLWRSGKYFNKKTKKLEDLIVGRKYKKDEENYIYQVD